jgi:hypothetical protein
MDAVNWLGLTINMVGAAANSIQLWFTRPKSPQDETACLRAFRAVYWHIAQYRVAFEAITHLLDSENVEDRGLDLARYSEALSIDDYFRLRKYSQDLRAHIDRLTQERDVIKQHYRDTRSNVPITNRGSDPWLDAYNVLMQVESQLRQLEHGSQISLGHMTRLVNDVTKVQRAVRTALEFSMSMDVALDQRLSDIDRGLNEDLERRFKDREIENDFGMDL